MTATLPSTTAPPLLEAHDVRTWFETPRGLLKAVDGVSLTIDRGRTLGIVGESGSGKSVLSRSLMGLLPRRGVQRSGTILYNGRDLEGLSDKKRRAMWGPEMAMIFQDPMTSLNPVVKIGRQLTEGLTHHLGMKGKDARQQALALLREVGIPAPARRIEEYPHQLSGGMRQRVVIAIGLACGPKLLFADEPTTALDVTVQAQILDLLKREQTDREMGMVLVTHDLGVVAGHTDDIAVMYGGKIVERAPTRVLFKDMKMPYTEALLDSIPKLEYDSHSRLSVIKGRPPDLIRPPEGCNFAPRCKYAQPNCHEEEPPLREADTPGHVYRCWYPLGTEANREALARNIEAGLVDPVETSVTIAGAPVSGG